MARDFFKSYNMFTEQEIKEIMQLFEKRKIDKMKFFQRKENKRWEIAFALRIT